MLARVDDGGQEGRAIRDIPQEQDPNHEPSEKVLEAVRTSSAHILGVGVTEL